MLQKSLVTDNLFETILTKTRSEILSLLIKGNLNILEKKIEFIISLSELIIERKNCED